MPGIVVLNLPLRDTLRQNPPFAKDPLVTARVNYSGDLVAQIARTQEESEKSPERVCRARAGPKGAERVRKRVRKDSETQVLDSFRTLLSDAIRIAHPQIASDAKKFFFASDAKTH